MIEFKDKKVIGIISILIICIIISLITYGRNKKNVFKDEYMDSIFVDESTEVNNYETDDIFYDESNAKKESEDNNVNKSTIIVEIKGEVVNPEVYILEEGSVIKDLIEAAGGLTSEADISNINRAKEIQNHDLIIIGNINNKDEIENVDVITEIDDGMININTAEEDELKTIPGIGDVKAKAIIDYRENNNGFKSIEEIKNIDGIGDKTFEKIKDKIKI